MPDAELRARARDPRDDVLGADVARLRRITPQMTTAVVRRLMEHDIKVKGYFILGFPTETLAQMTATERHIHDLWATADATGGSFRASVFEFRPYPGTPEWHRLMATGRYSAEELLDYQHVDLTAEGADEAMRERDELNFSVGLQFGEAPVARVRTALARITREQDARKHAVVRATFDGHVASDGLPLG